MARLEQVNRKDVERVLLRVEQTIDPDAANLVRAYLDMLEGQVRAYQLGDDQVSDDALAWIGTLE